MMSHWQRSGLLLLLTAGLFVGNSRAQEMTLELDPAKTTIEFTLGASFHTVHGIFALKSGTIRFNPSTGIASGLVVVDATSGNTENKGRDHKMHAEILESQHFPEITFMPTKVSGKIDFQADSNVQMDGIFKLHGADHPMSLTLPVQAKGNILTAQTHIVIPYITWGLKNPSTFVLHVSDQVEVIIRAVGKILPTQP
jgi:polyisoprenoid-binding protein YceI